MTIPPNQFASERWTVPVRRGPRPKTTHPTREQPGPHQQLSDIPPAGPPGGVVASRAHAAGRGGRLECDQRPAREGFSPQAPCREGPGGSFPARLRVRPPAPRTRRQPAPDLAARSLRRGAAGRLGRTAPDQRNHAGLRAARRGRVGGGLAAGLRIVQLGDGNKRRRDPSARIYRQKTPPPVRSGRPGRSWDAVEGRAPLPPQPGLRDSSSLPRKSITAPIEVAFAATEAFTTLMGDILGGFRAAMLYNSNIRMLPVRRSSVSIAVPPPRSGPAKSQGSASRAPCGRQSSADQLRRRQPARVAEPAPGPSVRRPRSARRRRRP